MVRAVATATETQLMWWSTVSAADDDKSTRCQQLVGDHSVILLHVQCIVITFYIAVTFIKSRYIIQFVRGTCYDQFYNLQLGAKSGNISNV